VQEPELLDHEEQEEYARQAGDPEILQALQKTHRAQGDKSIKAISSFRVKASSSNWQSIGLQIRGLGVRIPPGLPFFIEGNYKPDGDN
jgi:hypothetical protein